MSSMDFKKKHSIATVNTSMRIEKPIQTHGKLFRNSSLSEKIPPPIIEVTVEDDNSSLDHVEHKDSSVTTIKYEKELDDRERRKYSNKSVDSRTRNSVASATTSSGQEDDENVNRLSIRNDLTRSNSAGNSIRSSTRCSSVQSLSVIREQYCCFTKWTPCERILGGVVGIMAIIIVILIVIVGILSTNTGSNFSKLTMSL